MPITKASSNAVAAAAKGDLVVGTATNDSGVLAVGANDQVLTVDSSTATGLKWATASAGGMTLISTTTLTGASITLSSIPATYNNLQLVIQDYLPTDDSRAIRMRFNGDTSSYYATIARGSEIFGNTFNLTSLQAGNYNDNAVAKGLSVYNIYNYANTVTWKMLEMISLGVNQDTTTNFNFNDNMGFYNQTTAISSITLFPFAGSFTSGTALLYGVS
jgi:hypothetical protein